MTILDNIKLLYCLNDAGVNKAYEVLGSLLDNAEYLQKSPEQFSQELNEQLKQDKAKLQKEEQLKKEKHAAELKALRDKHKSVLSILSHQRIPAKIQLEIIEAIKSIGEGDFLAQCDIYTYGFIQGIKAERARRKKVAQ